METPSQGLMRCRTCGKDKPLNEMTAQSRSGSRRASIRCKVCENAYATEWRRRNAKKWLSNVKQWREKNKDRLSEYRKRRRRELPPDEMAALRTKEAEKTRRLNAALRDSAYTAYGGYVCACCGETEVNFLSIDHIANDGCKQRKEHGHGADFYRWLKKRDYPTGFQVLCMNCNYGKHRNGGVCPHQARRNDYSERK